MRINSLEIDGQFVTYNEAPDWAREAVQGLHTGEVVTVERGGKLVTVKVVGSTQATWVENR